MFRNVFQVIPSPPLTTVQIDTKIFDSLNEVSLVTYRFTPLRSGTYYLHGWSTFINTVPAGIVCSIALLDNTGLTSLNSKVADGANNTYMHTSKLFALDIGDWVVLQVAQNSGVNRNTINNASSNVFEGFRVY